MIKRLAIIPARSGSVRIKNKNIKLFNKKPVIYYTLEICKKSRIQQQIDKPPIKKQSKIDHPFNKTL